MDPLTLLSLIDYRVELALWVVFSIGLYALGVDIAWHYRRSRPGRLGQWAETLKGWPHHHWLLEAVRFLYYIGLPYAALLRGVALPRLMGLTHLDWVKGIGLGAALGGGAFLLLALIWWWYARAIAALPLSARERRGESLGDDSTTGWILLREVIYLETHWAFYRSAAILFLDKQYAGVFLGFLLVTLEWSINPAWRANLSVSWRSANILLRWSLALVTAIIFLFIRNLWLLAPIHWGIEMVCQRLLAGFSQRLGVSPREQHLPSQDIAKPTVMTMAPSSITSNSTLSGGNVTSAGGATVTARGVCWSASPNPTTGDSHTTDGSGAGSFTSNITGLSPGTTYHIRAYAANTAGTAYGGGVTFTTENTGDADLMLSDSPITTIAGDDADQFSVQAQPTPPVALADSTR